MHLNQRKEKLSRAYICALCSSVGCSVAGWDVDDDSVDLTLKKTNASGAIPSPMLDVQLKATARPRITREGVSFPLKTKNFKDLRAPTHYPRILVIVALPDDDPALWLEQVDETRLSLMSCGYWAAIADLDLPENETSTTVKLQRQLTAEALDDLMERISNGRPLVG
jgi:hypothetical protein